MRKSALILLGTALTLTACNVRTTRTQTLRSFQDEAAQHRLSVTLPEFERSPAALAASVTAVLDEADRRLAAFAMQEHGRVSFESTFKALDGILYPVVNLSNRVFLMKETQVDADMRTACTDQVERLNEWFVAFTYRMDLYEVCKAFEASYRAGSQPKLTGEELKLMEDGMRDYRRSGLELAPETRARVEELQNKLNSLSNEFDSAITDAQAEVRFRTDELPGVPAGFLKGSDNGDGTHTVRPTTITDYLAVMQNCPNEETRKRLKIARFSVAMNENLPVLKQLVEVRDEIASLLNYASWADYQIEPRMAQNSANALAFAEDLARGLTPKFEAEKAAFQKMKADDTGNPDAELRIWDFRYYMTQLQKRQFAVDAEELRVFFELERVLDGMFGVFEDIFRLEIVPVKAPYLWHDTVSLYMVSDSKTKAPLGLFYFDPFPREGKYNHFAQFGIIDGKRLGNGTYQRPVVALVCNFTPPADGKPSLLAHDEVETLFHEFGHALHTILTQAEYVTFSGTNVPRDFVEAPSQMLENWVWDPVVLDRFAVDYRDPSRKIDPEVLRRLKEADLATQGMHYRRQLGLALSDLRMHAAGENKDPGEIANATMAEVFLAPPAGTGFAAYWGHLTGYDAGYYGYAWADSIAADLATAFENAPNRFLDAEVGMRLRNEIYAVGGARDANESIEKFLGRPKTNDAFVQSLGIE